MGGISCCKLDEVVLKDSDNGEHDNGRVGGDADEHSDDDDDELVLLLFIKLS